MLTHAWLIPAVPALSFLLILFFGKRLPRGGSEIGIAALASLQVSYAAFDKEQGQLAAKKMQ